MAGSHGQMKENEFIDHNGNKVHYDKYQDALLDKDGKDVSDGTNILTMQQKNNMTMCSCFYRSTFADIKGGKEQMDKKRRNRF